MGEAIRMFSRESSSSQTGDVVSIFDYLPEGSQPSTNSWFQQRVMAMLDRLAEDERLVDSMKGILENLVYAALERVSIGPVESEEIQANDLVLDSIDPDAALRIRRAASRIIDVSDTIRLEQEGDD